MKKILFIIGSLRAKSFNRQVANVAKEIIGNRAEVSEMDYSDLPLLNQDIEQPEPAAVARIRKAVSEAEVLQEQVGIAVPAEAWGTDVLALTDEQKAQLKEVADKLMG